MHSDAQLDLIVASSTRLAEDIVLLELRSGGGEDLPAWEPGAHIDLVLGENLVRQYSLCSSPADRSRWQVAVHIAPDSRGGSIAAGELRAGDRIRTSHPRNNFRLKTDQPLVFLAGGIGITPIVPMVAEAVAAGLPATLLYGARTETSLVFQEQLRRQLGDHARLFAEDRDGRPDLQLLEQLCAEGPTRVYCCGPQPMLKAVTEAVARVPNATLVSEQFAPDTEAEHAPNTAFTIELSRSQKFLEIPADATVLDIVRAAGVFVPSSCQEGTCGSCETVVLEGTPDHRDAIGDPGDPDRDETMFICVSRAKSDRLVLEL